jgi:hypothetical protein
VHAGETVISPEPIGGTDLNQALLPPTGLYGGLAYVGPPDQARHFTDTNGNVLPPSEDVKVKAFIGAVGLLYVYPWKPFGGSIATSLQMSYWDLFIGPTSPPTYGRRTGFGDIYSDAFYYSKYLGLMGATAGGSEHIPYGLTVAGGFAFKAPTGAYVVTNSFNVGSNLWILTPNIAVTYNTGPNWSLGDSTQLSARLFTSFPMKNGATNYQSGNVVDVDWSISQVFGRLQVGVAGAYAYQFTNDTGTNVISGLRCPSAACVDGNRNGQFAIGPVLEYTFPNGIFIKAKYSANVWSKNTDTTHYSTIQIGMKLF